MPSNNATDPFPRLNPDTPMAFLPPGSTEQYMTGTYLSAVVNGAWLMDVFLSISEEMQIYRHKKFKLPDLLYFSSRIAVGGFLLTSFILSSAPVHSCPHLLVVTRWFSGFTAPLNASLFLLRLWGVFYDSKPVAVVFTILWLSTFSSFLSASKIKTQPIGPTKYCVVEDAPRFVSLIFIVIAIYDTLVFGAITVKIVLNSPVQEWKSRWDLVWNLKGSKGKIGYVSRALLQTGQLYYFFAIVANIAATTIVLIPSVPVMFKGGVAGPTIALQNVLACRVFRLLKLGLLKTSIEPVMSTIPSSPDRSIRFNVPTECPESGSAVCTDYTQRNRRGDEAVDPELNAAPIEKPETIV